ncbi:MAG: hypothetical protein WD768_21720 [Phycisphaeraceae bacterium]
MSKNPDYILDLSTSPRNAAGSKVDNPASLRGRPWLAIQWKCCSVYSRVYRNAAGTAYDARCPRCGRVIHVQVGEGGTSSRFFEAR